MTLNQIYYFAKTAELMHMANAAKELMIAQPSLSMSISKLEEELGVSLFEKHGRGIALTPEGLAFLNHAKRIIEDVEAANLEMAKIKSNVTSSVSVGYINPLADHVLPTLFHDFKQSCKLPQIHLASKEMNTAEVPPALQNNSIDLALCSILPRHNDLTQIPIMRQPLVLIVSEGHPLEKQYQATGKPLPCSVINGYPNISYYDTSPMRTIIADYLKAHHVVQIVDHTSFNENSIASLVSEGLGIAILAQTEHLDYYKVSTIPLEGNPSSRNIYLTYRTNRKHYPVVMNMIQFIQQRFPQPIIPEDEMV